MNIIFFSEMVRAGQGVAVKPEIRGRIIGLHESGFPNSYVARKTGVSLSTVKSFISRFKVCHRSC